MPKSDYSFLSDTQLEYLKNPDQFNSQRSAEISYRIRQKYKSVKDDFELLEDTVEVWDKLEERNPATLECGFKYEVGGPDGFGGCEHTLDLKPIGYFGELSGVRVRRVPDIDWIRIRGTALGDYQDGVYRTFYTGFCSTCQQKAHEYAREHGTVPCSHSKHTAHRPDSNVFNECYEKGNIPLSDEDLRSIDEITTPEKVAETG